MFTPKDVICEFCKRVFCCSDCRSKHVMNNHMFVPQKPVICPQPITEDKIRNKVIVCPICESKPLLFRKEIYKELLEHVAKNHLPLHCRKCNKLYRNSEDLRQFSKCFSYALEINKENDTTQQVCDEAPKDTDVETINMKSNIATQTSPLPENNSYNKTTNVQQNTSYSVVNYCWKTKNKLYEEFLIDNVSSIPNISSINNSSMRRSIDVAPITKSKLVRTTSTPVHPDLLLAKPKEQTFNGSSGQVSSIYNSGCESLNSPALLNTNGTPTAQQPQIENMNRYRKVTARTKMTAVTPLRQVMSKSIQKAFAEHGGLPPTSLLNVPINATANSIGEALDLRVTPVIKRHITHCFNTDIKKEEIDVSEPFIHQEIMLSAQKLTTEAIFITRQYRASHDNNLDTNNINTITNITKDNQSTSDNSLYKTCHSVEIITSSQLREINIKQNPTNSENTGKQYIKRSNIPEIKLENSENFPSTIPPITPITSTHGALVNKKAIIFEKTPPKQIQNDETLNNDENSVSELYYTPNTTPARKKNIVPLLNPSTAKSHFAIKRPSIKECSKFKSFNRIESIDNEHEPIIKDHLELKEKKTIENKDDGGSSIWSLVSSVMRLPTFKTASFKSDNNNNSESQIKSKSLLKRCASIAGSLVRSKPSVDEEQFQSLKRKRVYTLDNRTTNISPTLNSTDSDELSLNYEYSNVTSKRYRIHGRKPIERMRRIHKIE